MNKREYLEAIKPFIDIKIKVYETCASFTLLDGEIEYNFSPEAKEALRLADEAIQFLFRRTQ